MAMIRIVIITIGLIAGWQLLVTLTQLPAYILPGPVQVMQTLWQQKQLIFQQSIVTVIETLAGLILGAMLGATAAIGMAWLRPVRIWVMPVLVFSQAIPTFAIAPLLVIWLGYGMASKIVTTMLMLFFPVTSAFFDGLCRTPSAWLEMAQIMNASRWQTLWRIRVPAALPALAPGLRVATAAAPIGAIVGEWVGASQGLGFLMLNANARMQIDLLFAVLLVIIVFSLLLYFIVDKFLRYVIAWN